jgi:NAD(P)-dependent dehydrogenase (short-subunit alcohol dehydrogenase family)
MAFTGESVPDLSGRVAVITGGNGGLGFETSRVLAAKGAHVVIAARNLAKAEAAVSQIRAEVADASVDVVALDLASQSSVRDAARAIIESHRCIDILVNNAGVMAVPERTTEDGFEMQLAVNHLGHWTLTALLLPSLLAARRARVVTVTSTAHHLGRPLNPDNPHLHGRYEPWRAYGQSKLANFLFGLGLNREFVAAGAAAQSLVAHPGLSRSELQTTTVAAGGGGRSGPFWAWMAAHTGMSVAAGALPQIRAATDPRARGGEFYGPRYGNFGPAVRRPILRRDLDESIRTLWEVSERETGVALRVR